MRFTFRPEYWYAEYGACYVELDYKYKEKVFIQVSWDHGRLFELRSKDIVKVLSLVDQCVQYNHILVTPALYVSLKNKHVADLLRVYNEIYKKTYVRIVNGDHKNNIALICHIYEENDVEVQLDNGTNTVIQAGDLELLMAHVRGRS